MSSDQSADTTETANDDLDLLKLEADKLSISYHPSIGAEKLKNKILKHRLDQQTLATIQAQASSKPAESEEVYKKNKAQLKNERHARLRKEANRLVRVRITCHQRQKSEYAGEIFTVSNSVIGTIKRYVPFGNPEGWHVEQMILNMIQERQFVQHVTVTDRKGRKVKQPKLVPEFAIEIMKPLTPKELTELARKQAIANNIDKD